MSARRAKRAKYPFRLSISQHVAGTLVVKRWPDGGFDAWLYRFARR